MIVMGARKSWATVAIHSGGNPSRRVVASMGPLCLVCARPRVSATAVVPPAFTIEGRPAPATLHLDGLICSFDCPGREWHNHRSWTRKLGGRQRADGECV